MTRKSNKFIFNPHTEIELVAIRGKEVFKKVMKYEDALNLKKKKGWIYRYYQIGYSQFNN